MEGTSPISLQNIWRVIRQRWLLVLASTLVLFSAVAMYVLTLTPRYTAEAVVLLAPMTEELADATTTARGLATTDPFFIRSETAIIGSAALSRDVIEQLGLAKSPEFRPQPGLREQLGLAPASRAAAHPYLSADELTLDQVTRGYQERLGVFNDGRNKTVEIAFTAGDPRLAAQIANAHAEAYLHEQATRRGGSQQKSLDWLKQEVDARAQEVRDAEAEVQKYQLDNNIVTTRDSTIVEQRLSQLSAQLVDARRQLSTQQALLAEIRNVRAGGDAANAVSLLANEPLTDLLRSRVQAESALTSMESRLTSNHPTVVKQRELLASINGTLEKQLARVENEAAASLSSWRRQVGDLSGAVNTETTNKLDQDRVSSALPALLAQAQVKRTVFETVLNRYQTKLAERGYSEPTAAVVSRARAPAQASFPKTNLFLAVGLIAALLAACFIALLIEMLRPRSLSLTALADAVGLRALVAIPRFRNESRDKGVVKIRDPRLYIESIRSMRNAIFEQQSARDMRVCLFTSVEPSQGKTLVAMSLARSLARTGTRTLFLEMDLRCPAAGKLARIGDVTRGVAAVLEARAQVHEVVVRDETTSLDMLLAEKNAAQALDKLTVATFSGLLGKLRTKYDAIVVDSPPVGMLSDSLTLACVADQTVIVTRDGETSIADLAHTVRLLRERGATLAGLALTDVDPRQMSLSNKNMSRYVIGMPTRLATIPRIGKAG